MHTYAETNQNSASYRLTQRVAQPTREQEVEQCERYLTEMANFSFTQAYKCFEARYATLTGSVWSGSEAR